MTISSASMLAVVSGLSRSTTSTLARLSEGVLDTTASLWKVGVEPEERAALTLVEQHSGTACVAEGVGGGGEMSLGSCCEEAAL